MELKVLTHKINPEHSISLVDKWKITDKKKKEVKKFIRDYALGKVTGRIGNNTNASIERNLHSLKVGLENLNSETKKDVELFMDRILQDKIKSSLKKPYSLKSKKAIIDMLKRYLDYHGKDNITKPLSVKISSKEKDHETLTKEEIDKLYESTDIPKYKYFLAVLYGGGMRAEEFHNIRFSDIEIPKGKNIYVRINLRNEFSKTKGRTINLYYDKCLEAVKKYLSLRIDEGIKPNEPVFPITYLSMRDWIKRHGEKVLNKSVNYHMLRHSTATEYASSMNRQQLCYYFGWKFSSNMPDIYINRSGVEMNNVNEKFEKTELDKLKGLMKEMEETLNNRNKELLTSREAMSIMHLRLLGKIKDKEYKSLMLSLSKTGKTK